MQAMQDTGRCEDASRKPIRLYFYRVIVCGWFAVDARMLIISNMPELYMSKLMRNRETLSLARHRIVKEYVILITAIDAKSVGSWHQTIKPKRRNGISTPSIRNQSVIVMLAD